MKTSKPLEAVNMTSLPPPGVTTNRRPRRKNLWPPTPPPLEPPVNEDNNEENNAGKDESHTEETEDSTEPATPTSQEPTSPPSAGLRHFLAALNATGWQRSALMQAIPGERYYH